MAPLYTRLRPQLLDSNESASEGDEWLHEIKHDGYRMTISISGGNPRLYTRNGYDWTERFPTLTTEILRLGLDSVALDGELVCLGEEGTSDFSALQRCVSSRNASPLLYLFDLPHLSGYDLFRVPLLKRKEILRGILKRGTDTETSRLRYSEHIEGNGPTVFTHACLHRLEGIVSKRADSPYRAGRRSPQKSGEGNWKQRRQKRFHLP